MTPTPQASTDAGTLGSPPSGTAVIEPSDSSTRDRPDDQAERSEAFDAMVEEIRRRWAGNVYPFVHLEDLVRRRLGMAFMSPGAAVLSGLLAVGMRLILALAATAVAGQWAEVPWGRWAVILIWYGVFDATQPLRTPPLDVPLGRQVRRMVEEFWALLNTIERESDLRDLADYARRWIRPWVATMVGVTVASIALVACWLIAPSGLNDLHAGSIVLLTLMLFDFGAAAVTPSDWVLLARESKYAHRLFWPSPADSPEVHMAMRMTTGFGFATGMWITVYLVLAAALVSLESPVVVPLALGFIVIGYLFTFASAAGVRGSIQKIVRRARNQRLAVLQSRIDAVSTRFADLSPEESERVGRLIELHHTIRDAPTTPTASRTLARNAAGLIVPTIVFVITVFGEVSAERFLDAILP